MLGLAGSALRAAARYVASSLASNIPGVAGASVTTTLRDHNIVVVLVADHLFAAGTTELSRVGRQTFRDLARALCDLADRTFRLVIDTDRAMEVAAMLVVAGLNADTIEVSLRMNVDRAIDLIEIELVPAELGETP